MSSNYASEKTVSDVQTTTTEQRSRKTTVEREPSGRLACPECEGQVITADEESFCRDCGLVVADEWVDLSPTMTDLGLIGNADQSIETVDPLRTDKGLHTKIGKSTDGHGNPLSNEQWKKFQRLRKWHKRYQFGEKRKRTKRLNEGLRDIEMIGGNLDLPDYVIKMAARYLRSASEARLPGGRMAWEALAGGAVLVAARASPINRDEIDVAVAMYTKAPHERVCAAARKIRCECGFDAPLIRPNAVMEVVDALDDDAIPGARAVRTWRLAQHLMQLGDQVPVGPGTPRCTVAASALLDNYRAGHKFEDLLLVVCDPEEIVSHRTVYAGDRFALRIDESAGGNPWARLGSRPWRSWASTWTRLTAHPFDVDHDKHDMVLDANLRRIWSWSTALQYIEDLETRRENA